MISFSEKLGTLGQLYWTFFKIGPSCFGGGYAMLPVIEREIVEKRRWFTEYEMVDMLSLAGTAPGGIGVNAAAFIGYRKAGFLGAAAAVAGITMPTFLIVVLLSLAYLSMKGAPKVEAALKGIHGAVVALIVMAAYRMAKVSLFDVATTFMTAAALLILLLTKINPFLVILLGTAAGLIVVQAKEWMGIEVRIEKSGNPTNSKRQLEPEYFI